MMGDGKFLGLFNLHVVQFPQGLGRAKGRTTHLPFCAGKDRKEAEKPLLS